MKTTRRARAKNICTIDYVPKYIHTVHKKVNVGCEDAFLAILGVMFTKEDEGEEMR